MARFLDRACSCSQELKAALKAAGKPVTGKKDELIERLLEAEGAAAAAEPSPSPSPAPAAAATTAPVPTTAPAAATADLAAEKKEGEETKEEAGGKHAKIVFAAAAPATAAGTATVRIPTQTSLSS